MDIHVVDGSIEVTETAHPADLAVQKKYGVDRLQCRFNVTSETVEGMDKEFCSATPWETNGLEAYQTVDVQEDLYDLLMSENQKVDHGLVWPQKGESDSGNRYRRPWIVSQFHKIPAQPVLISLNSPKAQIAPH